MKRGRPKQFDEAQALERAMELFWSRGYAGAGLSELTAEMGISRQSLYDTFGDKRALFIRSIEHYRATRLQEALSLLSGEGSPLGNVKAAVAFFEQLAADDQGRGCLVANAVVEVAPRDPELARFLEETLEILQDAVRAALERAQEQGELAANRSPEALSRALTNAMIGMAVTGKLRRDRAILRDVYAGTLAMLD